MGSTALRNVQTFRQRVPTLLASVGATLCLIAGPEIIDASASTSSTIGVAGAVSYGFRCNATYNWIHENWPDIWVRSTRNQYVYVRTLLYRWNGSAWTRFRTSIWYVGVSNNTGRQQIGHTLYGVYYWFAIAGHPSTVPPSDGYAFTYLPNGYYKTREQYEAAGYTWKAWNRVQGSSARYCRV